MKFAAGAVCLLCVLAALSACAGERNLGSVRSAAGALVLTQDHEQLVLAVDVLRLPLKTLEKHATGDSCTCTLGAPEVYKLTGGAEALIVPISFAASAQNSQSLSVLLIRTSATAPWSCQREWSVERSLDNTDDKPGTKDETQAVTFADGALHRHVHRRNVENIEYTLPCGCCRAIQTRTVESDEDETFSFDARREQLERSAYRKWYIVQHGEGLLAVARKALGDPRRLARLYALNSTLKSGATLTEGQKILVESE